MQKSPNSSLQWSYGDVETIDPDEGVDDQHRIILVRTKDAFQFPYDTCNPGQTEHTNNCRYSASDIEGLAPVASWSWNV